MYAPSPIAERFLLALIVASLSETVCGARSPTLSIGAAVEGLNPAPSKAAEMFADC